MSDVLQFPRLGTAVSHEEQERRETMLFAAVVCVLLAHAIVGAQIFVAIAAAFGLLYIVPAEHLRKLLGYLLFSDLLFSAWLVGVAATTLGGLEIAIVAGLSYSLITREIRRAWGYQKLAINGEVRFGPQFALLGSQAIAWVKAFARGVRSNSVEAPEPLTWSWVETDFGGGLQATKTWQTCTMAWEGVRGLFKH